MKLLKQIRQLPSRGIPAPHFKQLKYDEAVSLRFYRSKEELWYVDMPGWQGSIDALEMVQGADELLDHLCQHTGKDVHLQVSIREFDECEKLLKIQNDVVGGGAYYAYATETAPKILWLCSVSNWYFGDHPDVIFFKSINE